MLFLDCQVQQLMCDKVDVISYRCELIGSWVTTVLKPTLMHPKIWNCQSFINYRGQHISIADTTEWTDILACVLWLRSDLTSISLSCSLGKDWGSDSDDTSTSGT